MQVTRRLLASTNPVKAKARESADERPAANASLIDGEDDLKRTEQALAESRAALAASQLALAHALAAIEKVRDLALHDHLTGLPNRQLFEDRLDYAIALAARREWNLAVIFLDLDGFKAINDELGHAAGDQVLSETAARLTRKVRFADTVCRYGGDEFVLLLMNPQARSNIERIAQEILSEIAAPIQFGDRELRVGASLGIAVYPDQGQEGMALISDADAAMYFAKKSAQRIAFV